MSIIPAPQDKRDNAIMIRGPNLAAAMPPGMAMVR